MEVHNNVYSFDRYSRRGGGTGLKPGRYIHDKDSGRSGYFIGYCTNPECHSKIMASHDYLKRIKVGLAKQERSLRYRLIKFLENSIQD